MADKKDCTTCKFSDEKVYNEPCETCKASDVMYTNWIAKSFINFVWTDKMVLEFHKKIAFPFLQDCPDAPIIVEMDKFKQSKTESVLNDGVTENTGREFGNDDLDRNGNVKLIKFLLGRIGVLKPKNESQEVAIEAIKSMITETDYFGNGKSLIHIENENAGSLEYALNKFHAINDIDLQPRAMQPTEAQSLIDIFYEKMAFQSTELRRHEIAKQCAIIHCNLMIEALKKIGEFTDVKSVAHYTTLKQKIEAL